MLQNGHGYQNAVRTRLGKRLLGSCRAEWVEAQHCNSMLEIICNGQYAIRCFEIHYQN